jgi:hypothetical protein
LLLCDDSEGSIKSHGDAPTSCCFGIDLAQFAYRTDSVPDIGNTNKQGMIYGESEIKKEAEQVKTKGF